MVVVMSEYVPIDKMINLIEINVGKWKPTAVVIIDETFRIWGLKGELPEEALNLFRKYILEDIKPGDSIHNGHSFLMKVTEKTAVIVSMKEPSLAVLASANLRGRVNALSDFYGLEKLVVNLS
jgi:hypothetical protein